MKKYQPSTFAKYSTIPDSKVGQLAKMRPEVKKYIDNETRTAPYPYAVSSVEGNMFIDGLNKEIKKKYRQRMNREEWEYASKRLWKVQKYTNYSGD